MPKFQKELNKCKHPNSRKTKALAKKVKQNNNKHKQRLSHAVKSNLLAEKLAWFLSHVENRKTPLNPEEFADLIKLYFKRFDEELEQIKIKQSISKHRINQHAARENVIKFTLEREKNEYNSGGIELLNLCDPAKLKALKEWDGNAINVQHFKLDLISRNSINNFSNSIISRNSLEKSPKKMQNPIIIVTASSDGEQKDEIMSD